MDESTCIGLLMAWMIIAFLVLFAPLLAGSLGIMVDELVLYFKPLVEMIEECV